jgi:hypothetical protein
MQIHCLASIPLELDEPVPAIRQFVHLLRNSAVATDRTEVTLNLIGTSARARTTIQQFRPERAKDQPLAHALDIAEELTNLGAAQIKSLHFILSADGFRWKGASEASSAKLLLLDAKSLQRRQRFNLSAHLLFEASDPHHSSVAKMLEEIARATRIRFEVEASLMNMMPYEPGRASPEELFVTVLSWIELMENVGFKIREKISLARVPRLMTTPEAHKFLFDPGKFGKSVRVDFTRIVRKWLKHEFPNYTRYTGTIDGEQLHKQIAEGLIVTLVIDKKPRSFSKEFTINLGVGLTSPRFAPTPDRPFHLAVNLFRLFGFAPLPMQWTYYTEADLHEALRSAAALVKQVLPIFESEAIAMQRAYQRSIGEFEGPREFSAKEAYELALPIAKAWAEDAGLMRIVSNTISAQHTGLFPLALPSMYSDGRLAVNGGWCLQFHSRSKSENLYVTIPCRGRIQHSVLDAPAGRHWPSDADQIFRDGWIDSLEALRIARAAAEQKGAPVESGEIQQFELSSQANAVKAWPTLRPPFRDGMFPMDRSWRISFSHTSERERKITAVTVPAYGDGPPNVTVQAFDKQGRPVRP